MRLTADVRSLIADLQATLAGSREGRSGDEPAEARVLGLSGRSRIREQSGTEPVIREADTPRPNPAGIESGRPSLEPTGWHEQYTARMAAALRKQAIRTAQYKRKLWREAEAARAERRAGKTYGPAAEGEDVFRGFREEK